MSFLKDEQKISCDEFENIIEWIDRNPLSINDSIINECRLSSYSKLSLKYLSFEERAALSKHPLSQKLFSLMAKKGSNLCVAVDFTNSQQIIDLAEKVGPFIAILKTHIDIVEDFEPNFITKLKEIAAKHEFLIFEDRKFSDIGQTVQLQYSKGVYRISEWAHLINAHIVSGPGVIKGLKSAIESHSLQNKGCLLIAQMSSKGSLTNNSYAQSAYKMAVENNDFIIGFISQSRISSEQTMIHLTPGVNIVSSGDSLDQMYVSPETAIIERGADVIIVGRGITNADNPQDMANLYRKRAFDAYLKKIST